MYQTVERVTRCFWVIALVIALAMLSHCIDPNEPVSAAPIHWSQNQECAIYVISGQAPQDDHITFQVEVFGQDIEHAEYLTHHSWEVAYLVNAYMQAWACDVTWVRAEV